MKAKIQYDQGRHVVGIEVDGESWRVVCMVAKYLHKQVVRTPFDDMVEQYETVAVTAKDKKEE